MVISDVSPAIPVLTLSSTNPAEPDPEQTLTPPEADPESVPSLEPADDAGTTEQGSLLDLLVGERGEGALRKLLMGHGNGVSTLRLRINFHDELTRIQDRIALQEVVAAGGSLTELIGDGIEIARDTLALSEGQAVALDELRSAFGAEVSELIDAYSAAETRDGQSLAAGVESAFAGLVSGIEERLAEAEILGTNPEPSLTAAESPEQQPALVLSAEARSFLDSLRATFADGFMKLTSALETTRSHLPELPGPRGNGRAYAKFLVRYEALQAPPTVDDSAGKPETLAVPMSIDIQA